MAVQFDKARAGVDPQSISVLVSIIAEKTNTVATNALMFAFGQALALPVLEASFYRNLALALRESGKDESAVFADDLAERVTTAAPAWYRLTHQDLAARSLDRLRLPPGDTIAQVRQPSPQKDPNAYLRIVDSPPTPMRR
jgi:hypothetical protein